MFRNILKNSYYATEIRKPQSYITQSHYYKFWSVYGAGLYYVLVSYDTVYTGRFVCLFDRSHCLHIEVKQIFILKILEEYSYESSVCTCRIDGVKTQKSAIRNRLLFRNISKNIRVLGLFLNLELSMRWIKGGSAGN